METTTTNTNTMGDYEFAFNTLKSLATMLSKQVSTRAVMDAIVESVNGDVADEYMRERVIEKFDADDMIDHVVNNCNKSDLFATIHTADMIDYVFEYCKEDQLFDRVQSFVADLDDSQFRKIING